MYVCKTMRMCSFLLEKGFKIYDTQVDKFNSKFNIWLFKATPEIRQALGEYKRPDQE